MAKVASEYEVESIFIEKLGEMGYDLRSGLQFGESIGYFDGYLLCCPMFKVRGTNHYGIDGARKLFWEAEVRLYASL